MKKSEIAIIIFGLVVVVVVVVVVISFSSTSSSSNGGGKSGGGTGSGNIGDSCNRPEDCSSKICGKSNGKCSSGCNDSLDCSTQIPFNRFCDTIGPVSSIKVSGFSISNSPQGSTTVNFTLTGNGSGCVGTVIVTGGFGGGMGDFNITNPGTGYTSYGNSLRFSGLPDKMTITVDSSDMSILIQNNAGTQGKCIDKP